MKLAQKIMIGYFRTKIRVLSVLSKRKAAATAFDLFCTPLRKPAKRTPLIFGMAEPLQFSLGDHMIYGHRWRSGPDAKKILIVHGFESSSGNFEKYIAGLLEKEYEVIAFDAPAHGTSTGSRINLPLYVSTLVKINVLYGPMDGYIAHSFGALAVTHLLERIPHDELVRAVLIAPATETVTTIDSFFSFLKIPSSVRKEFDRLIIRISGHRPEHYSIRRAVKNINATMMWFHDENDELTPVEDALKIKAEGYLNIDFRITKGLGHRRIYRDQRVMKEAVDFL